MYDEIQSLFIIFYFTAQIIPKERKPLLRIQSDDCGSIRYWARGLGHPQARALPINYPMLFDFVTQQAAYFIKYFDFII